MSIDLIAAALWLPLDPARKLVLVALCDRADYATGKCWPGRDEIALRSSLSLKSVTEHLKGLEADGWIKSRRGNSRAGETTTRWVNVARVLDESMIVVQAHRARVAARLGEESTPDPNQLELLGEVDGRLGEVDGNDQVKLTALLGEAASLVTVIDPSYDPSLQPSARTDGFEPVDLSADDARFAQVLSMQTKALAIMPPMAVTLDAATARVKIREQDLSEPLSKALGAAAKACGRELRVELEGAA